MTEIAIRDFRYEKSNRQGRFRLEIDELDLVGPGLIAIMGDSGSGKSTLIGFLSAEDQSDYEGSLKVLGKEWRDLVSGRDSEMQEHRRNVGYIAQKLGLVRSWTVRETLEKALGDAQVPKQEWDARIRLSLQDLGIARYIDSPVRELSGGEQQRVSIARVLARRPPIIIADEPTSGLDVVNAARVIDLFRIASGNALVVIVTHQPAIAEMCDRQVEFRWGTKLPPDGAAIRRRVKTLTKWLGVASATLAIVYGFWTATERKKTVELAAGGPTTVAVQGNLVVPPEVVIAVTTDVPMTVTTAENVALSTATALSISPSMTVLTPTDLPKSTVDLTLTATATRATAATATVLPTTTTVPTAISGSSVIVSESAPPTSPPIEPIDPNAVEPSITTPTRVPTESDAATTGDASWPRSRNDSAPGLYAWIGASSVWPGTGISGMPDWVACDDARDYCLLGYNGGDHVLVQTDGFEIVGAIPDWYSDPKRALLDLGMTEDVADQILST